MADDYHVKILLLLPLIYAGSFIPFKIYLCGTFVIGACYALRTMQIRSMEKVEKCLNPEKRFHHAKVQPVFLPKINRRSSFSLIPRLQNKPQIKKKAPPIACVKPVRSQLNLFENQDTNSIKKSTTCDAISANCSTDKNISPEFARKSDVNSEIDKLYSTLKTLNESVAVINRRFDDNSQSQIQLTEICGRVDELTRDIAWEKLQNDALQMSLTAKETEVSVLERHYQEAAARVETAQKVCAISSKHIQSLASQQRMKISDCCRTVVGLLDTVNCLRKGKTPNLDVLLNIQDGENQHMYGGQKTDVGSTQQQSSEESVADVSKDLQYLSQTLEKLQESLLDYFIARMAQQISLK